MKQEINNTMQHLYVIELACSVGTGKTLDEFSFFFFFFFFFACSVMDRAESKICPVRTKQASSITVLLLWLYFKFPDNTARLYRRNARATKTKQENIISWTKTLLLTMPVSKKFCHILGQTTTKMFLLHVENVPVEHLFKHTINETSL